jgi:hypothetical protein
MPMTCSVLVHYYPMLGVDLHKAQAPGPVPPVPFSPHVVVAALYLGPWGILTGLPALTVKSQYGITMQKGTDIGPLIPHVCVPIPPNLLTPVYILGSASKSYFGVATVKVGGAPVAVAVAKIMNLNVNCGDIPTPSGYVMAPNTVNAGMTLGDFLSGLLTALVEGALQWVIGQVVGAIGEGIAGKLFKAALVPVVDAADAATLAAAKAAIASGTSQFGSEMIKGAIGTVVGLALGSPLGASGSNIYKALGLYNGPSDPNAPNMSSPFGGASGEVSGKAGDFGQHLGDGSTDQHPSAPPPGH